MPGCTGAAVTVTVPLTVSVADTSGLPQASLPVYAFDGTTYTGYNKTTNASGQASFTLPQGNYRFRADKSGTQYWSATADDCTIPGCTSVAVTLPAAGGMTPDGLLSQTAYQPKSDTVLILANWIVPPGEQIVSDGPVSAQSATQRKTSNLSLSPNPAPNRAILPAWGLGQTQKETPGLSLSSENAPSFDQNPTQTTISYTPPCLRLTIAWRTSAWPPALVMWPPENGSAVNFDSCYPRRLMKVVSLMRGVFAVRIGLVSDV